MKVTVHTRRACKAARTIVFTLTDSRSAYRFARRLLLNVGRILKVDWRRGTLIVDTIVVRL